MSSAKSSPVEPLFSVVGDSHVSPLRKAIATGLIDADRQSVHYSTDGTVIDSFVMRSLSDEPVLNPLVTRSLRIAGYLSPSGSATGLEKPLWLLFGTGESHRIGLSRDFDIHRMFGIADNESGGSMHPDLLWHLIQARLKPLGDGLELLVRLGLRPRLLFGPPPHRDVASIIGAKYPNRPHLPTSEFRLEVYTQLEKSCAAIATEAGVEFDSLAVGKASDGFLEREFESDGVHANASYGQRILEELLELAGR